MPTFSSEPIYVSLSACESAWLVSRDGRSWAALPPCRSAVQALETTRALFMGHLVAIVDRHPRLCSQAVGAAAQGNP